MSGEGEKANYITCPKGHKVFVVWSPTHRKFAFTCDECEQHSDVALSLNTGHVVKLKIVRRLRNEEYQQA